MHLRLTDNLHVNDFFTQNNFIFELLFIISLLAAFISYFAATGRMFAHLTLVGYRLFLREPLRIDRWWLSIIAIPLINILLFFLIIFIHNSICISLGVSTLGTAHEAKGFAGFIIESLVALVVVLVTVFILSLFVLPQFILILRDRFRGRGNWRNTILVVVAIAGLPYSMNLVTLYLPQLAGASFGFEQSDYYTFSMARDKCSNYLIGEFDIGKFYHQIDYRKSEELPFERVSGELLYRSDEYTRQMLVTTYWTNETVNTLALEAPDVFGCSFSPIKHNVDNGIMGCFVFLYRLLCTTVLGALLFGPALHRNWLRRKTDATEKSRLLTPPI